MTKTILSIGTYDTKNAELEFIEQTIRAQGGEVLTMDVSVLGDPARPTGISKHEVARAGGMSIEDVIAQGDENKAFQVMAQGAAKLVADLFAQGRIDGMIALGGTMGTDLALDCAQALPMGVPKFIVSTVSFSSLIPPERLAPDIQMILWAGGLYGLNEICKSSLAQAAGAVLGAARAAQMPDRSKPLVGMTSLGSSCLSYMKLLKPALEDRGTKSLSSIPPAWAAWLLKAWRGGSLLLRHGFLPAGIRQSPGRFAGQQRAGPAAECRQAGHAADRGAGRA